MYKFLNIEKEEKDIIYGKVAFEKGISKAIVEKDFWVCVFLDILFNKISFSKYLIFKGGTSLSKGFNLINRFSEDIDLILDWRCLGIDQDEPYYERSNTAQLKYNKMLNNKTIEFLEKEFLPELKEVCSKLINDKIEIEIDLIDKQVINIYYPKLYDNTSILQFIRLEIGTLAALTPSKKISIEPYINEILVKYNMTFKTIVMVVSPERTFWEKATILHAESNRSLDKKMPKRYSRHYYDLYMLGKSKFKDYALNNIDLLIDVINFKDKFYKATWTNYNQIIKGNIMLVPPKERMKELKKDYFEMKEMLYGEIPSFEDILDYLNCFQKEINDLLK